jgi:hypothetical protein
MLVYDHVNYIRIFYCSLFSKVVKRDSLALSAAPYFVLIAAPLIRAFTDRIFKKLKQVKLKTNFLNQRK